MEHPAAFAAPLRYETLTVWTRDSWTRYRRPMKDKENTEYTIAEDGERRHGLGAVPLVPFLFEPTSPMTGLPATDDVLSLILRIYRRDSELDKMLFDRAVPLLNVGGVSLASFARRSGSAEALCWKLAARWLGAKEDGIEAKYNESYDVGEATVKIKGQTPAKEGQG